MVSFGQTSAQVAQRMHSEWKSCLVSTMFCTGRLIGQAWVHLPQAMHGFWVNPSRKLGMANFSLIHDPITKKGAIQQTE